MEGAGILVCEGERPQYIFFQHQTMKTILKRLGLFDVAKAAYQRVVKPEIFMRFPSYDAQLHREATRSYDYVRYATFGLAVARLQKEGIEGHFAELGVYKGVTSRFLHRLAPERRLYLFDTFEGFPEQDLEAYQRGDARFADTSVEAVRRHIGEVTNVVIRKGYFPETAQGLEQERFALVVLDMDLYKPTLAGMEFFYPRLHRGGYLFIHDYTSPESASACSRAVDEFLRDKPECVIELADIWGSAMIRKM